MTLPTITALPTPPARSDAPAVFNTNADAFLGAFPTLQSELNAYAAALPAAITGTDFSGTSTTSVLIATGSKSFTTQTGKQFQIGQSLRVAYTTTPANYMDGQVTSYDSGTGALVLNVSVVGGSGTWALWTISLAATGAGTFVTPTSTDILTNKTLTTPVLSGTVSGIVAGALGYLSGALSYGTGAVQRTVANLDEAQTLTTKTLALGSNTVSGTTAQFNTALTDGDFTTLAGSETLTNKTLTAPTINNGTITSATLITATIRANCTLNDTGTIAAESPGFRGLPHNARTAAYELVLTDAGKMVSNTTGGWTIPANGTVAFPIGSAVTLYNNSASSQTVAITTDTLRQHGTATTGTRTIPQRGFCTVVKVAATEWVAMGDVT